MNLPKRIVFFWSQGASAAPYLVRRCWDAWAEKNPNWKIEIAEANDAKLAMDAAGWRYAPQTMQGQADVFRVLDLAKNGGVYVDAATIPVRPLDDWLPELVPHGFFAFHDPYRKRSIENWFLAAQNANPVMMAWAESMKSYWDRPRSIQTRNRALDKGWKGNLSAWRDQKNGASPRQKKVIEPKDRLWSISPNGGAERNLHPYFWPHYLFEHTLETKPEIRATWAKMPKIPSYKELMLRHWKTRYKAMTSDDMTSLLYNARMQKLALNKTPSEEQMKEIFKSAGLSTYARVVNEFDQSDA